MKKCSCCGSYAVNPGRSGRDESSDLDLCDVCYWRKRADNTGKGQEITFGEALRFLKLGKRVTRAGWNGKDMWLKLVPADLADRVAFQYAALNALPWIGMKTADDKFVPWLASQTDVLAEDWLVIDYAQPADE